MRPKMITVILLTALTLVLTGCRHPLVDRADEFVRMVGGEYKSYVLNDPDMDETSKRIRIDNVESFKRLVEKCKE